MKLAEVKPGQAFRFPQDIKNHPNLFYIKTRAIHKNHIKFIDNTGTVYDNDMEHYNVELAEIQFKPIVTFNSLKNGEWFICEDNPSVKVAKIAPVTINHVRYFAITNKDCLINNTAVFDGKKIILETSAE